MEIRPMIFASAMKSRRDAIGIAMDKCYEWGKIVDIQPNEITGYGVQTYQGAQGERMLWVHEISFLVLTDRDIDWATSLTLIVDKWRKTEEYGRDNELVYESDRKAPPPPPAPVMPRTEEQDRFNVQNQNNRSAKMGAKGTFTYEEWVILRQHFGDICGRCKKPLVRPVIDHVIPLSRGGTNYIENIQTLCKDCNSGKGARPADYRDPELVLSFLEKLDEFRNIS